MRRRKIGALVVALAAAILVPQGAGVAHLASGLVLLMVAIFARLGRRGILADLIRALRRMPARLLGFIFRSARDVGLSAATAARDPIAVGSLARFAGFENRSGEEIAERLIENGTIVFVFDQRGGQRLAHRGAGEPRCGDGADRVHRLGWRDSDAAHPQQLDETDDLFAYRGHSDGRSPWRSRYSSNCESDNRNAADDAANRSIDRLRRSYRC